jgi:hypothetical protein
MAKAFEMLRDPLAFSRCFNENPCLRQSTKHQRKPLAAGEDPSLNQGPIFSKNAELALAFVQIESYRIHNGWPPG